MAVARRGWKLLQCVRTLEQRSDTRMAKERGIGIGTFRVPVIPGYTDFENATHVALRRVRPTVVVRL